MKRKNEILELHSGQVLLDSDLSSNLNLFQFLKIILPYWTDNTRLNLKKIVILKLRDESLCKLSNRLLNKNHIPFLYIYTEKKVEPSIPKHDGYEKVFEYTPDMKKAKQILMLQIRRVVSSKRYMDNMWEKFDAGHRPQAGQGGGVWKSYLLEFDTDYYNEHIAISLAHHITPA